MDFRGVDDENAARSQGIRMPWAIPRKSWCRIATECDKTNGRAKNSAEEEIKRFLRETWHVRFLTPLRACAH
jgi:hypothetical protein